MTELERNYIDSENRIWHVSKDSYQNIEYLKGVHEYQDNGHDCYAEVVAKDIETLRRKMEVEEL